MAIVAAISCLLAPVSAASAGAATTDEGSFPRFFTRVGSEVWFTATTPETGTEIFRVTREGEVELVVDAIPGSEGVDPKGPFVAREDGVVFFKAGFEEVWRTDGTPLGTFKLAEASDGTRGARELTLAGNRIFWVFSAASDGYLWVSDGTIPGTRAVEGTDAWAPSHLAALNGKVFFATRRDGKGLELYKSDGTGKGTKLVEDIAPGSKSSKPRFLTRVGDVLYFSAYRPGKGTKLWRTDGSAGGTRAVDDTCRRCAGGARGPRALTRVGKQIYFSAFDKSHGREVWRSDGTNRGTKMVADVNPNGKSGRVRGSSPQAFTRVNGKVYFSAERDDVGRELFRTARTRSGARLVADLRPAWADQPGSYPESLTRLDGSLVFMARDNKTFWEAELFRTDGTPATTINLTPTNKHYAGGRIARLGDAVFFQGSTKTEQRGVQGELWTSDGTLEGTAMHTNINKEPLGP